MTRKKNRKSVQLINLKHTCVFEKKHKRLKVPVGSVSSAHHQRATVSLWAPDIYTANPNLYFIPTWCYMAWMTSLPPPRFARPPEKKKESKKKKKVILQEMQHVNSEGSRSGETRSLRVASLGPESSGAGRGKSSEVGWRMEWGEAEEKSPTERKKPCERGTAVGGLCSEVESRKTENSGGFFLLLELRVGEHFSKVLSNVDLLDRAARLNV